MDEQNFKISPPPQLKESIFGPKMTTKALKIEYFRFFVGIHLEWSTTYFKTKISSLKIFTIEIFFQGHGVFRKMGLSVACLTYLA